MSVRSLNMVQLIGNLTRDPELRYTPQGTAVCTFGLATNREWTDQERQKQEEAEFHRIVAWHKLAELCSQLLFKGRKVYVEGRLQTRNWKGQDEQERQTTEVVIDNMIILDSRRKDGMEGGGAGASATQPAPVSQPASQPAAGQQPSNSPAQGKAQKAAQKPAAKPKSKPAASPKGGEEVKADDIPF
jgi:single-strand DNA-binding protein